MAHIRIAGLVPKHSKHAGTSWYWQPSATLKKAGWKGEPLGKDEGQAIARARAINEAVDQWKRGGPRPDQIRARHQQGTLGALIERYRRDVVNGRKPSGAPRIAEKTRAVYETSLKRLNEWAGQHPVGYVTPARVKVLRDATARPVDQGGIGQAAAFNLLRMGRQLYAFAETLEGPLAMPRGSNPFNNFALSGPPPRRQVWEAEDEAAFIAAAYALGRPDMALAIELAIYTAQRRGDLLAFSEPQLQQLYLYDANVAKSFADEHGQVWGWCFAQHKTTTEAVEVRMQIPFEPRLLARVQAAIRANRARDRAATPPRLLTHVLTDPRTGAAWKERAFHDAWTEIVAHAVKATGRKTMEALVWHDLRRTRVVRLLRGGTPKEMIAMITGHSLQAIDDMIRVYGPVDPNMTANALASTLAAPAQPEAPANPSNISA